MNNTTARKEDSLFSVRSDSLAVPEIHRMKEDTANIPENPEESKEDEGYSINFDNALPEIHVKRKKNAIDADSK